MENKLTERSHPETVTVIGAPSSAGARYRGQERAPEVLRGTGLLERLRSAGIDCRDIGDLPLIRYEPDRDHPKCQNLALVSAVARQLADRVQDALRAGHKLLVIGGDCTLALGVLAGLSRQRPDPGLLYFDGDIDMNTPEDTPSGILDGMVLAHITGRVVNELSQIGSSMPLVPEERIIAFGYNLDAGWIDPGEKERFDRSSIIKFPASQIRGSIAEHAMTARSMMEGKVESYLVHFDTDVVDEADFPAADVPHKHGVSLSDATTALRIFWSASQCAGMVVTEFNPARDPEGVYANRLTDVLVEAMKS